MAVQENVWAHQGDVMCQLVDVVLRSMMFLLHKRMWCSAIGFLANFVVVANFVFHTKAVVFKRSKTNQKTKHKYL